MSSSSVCTQESSTALRYARVEPLDLFKIGAAGKSGDTSPHSERREDRRRVRELSASDTSVAIGYATMTPRVNVKFSSEAPRSRGRAWCKEETRCVGRTLWPVRILLQHRRLRVKNPSSSSLRSSERSRLSRRVNEVLWIEECSSLLCSTPASQVIPDARLRRYLRKGERTLEHAIVQHEVQYASLVPWGK